MSFNKIHIASPIGAALGISVKLANAALPSYGMYRIEADVSNLAAKRATADLLLDCLGQMGRVECILLNVYAGPKVSLGVGFDVVGKSKSASTYMVNGEIPRDTLDILTALPYGEIALFGLATTITSFMHMEMPASLDATLAELGESVSWALGYDESGVVTILVRDKDVANAQIIYILKKHIGSFLE